jgi:ornithine cyclodeaminase/alanine dehydrogenase-like protein (mu-crystallin family)
MYKDGELTDADIHGNLVDVLVGRKSGRETADERVYFNAVGLAYVDVAIALAMYKRAKYAGMGRRIPIQNQMIFEHPALAKCIVL